MISSGGTALRYESGGPGSTVSEAAMAKKQKRVVAVKATKPPRNPYAKLLGLGPFKPKVAKKKDAYVRKPRHRKPLKGEVGGEEE